MTTITNADHLDMLPAGTIIRANDGDPYTAVERRPGQVNAWVTVCSNYRFLADEIPLPAVVLGRPEDEA